jgi:hypothetical protein
MMRWGVNLLQSPLPIVLACSRAMVREDFRAEMRRIEIPTLIVHGDRDRSMPVEITGKPSAELIPGCKLLVYPGAPHGLMFTHMGDLHADLLAFMRARDPSGRGLIFAQVRANSLSSKTWTTGSSPVMAGLETKPQRSQLRVDAEEMQTRACPVAPTPRQSK